jgi:hypothetical protein
MSLLYYIQTGFVKGLSIYFMIGIKRGSEEPQFIC